MMNNTKNYHHIGETLSVRKQSIITKNKNALSAMGRVWEVQHHVIDDFVSSAQCDYL